MTHDEFFAGLKRGEIAPAYLFQGEEAYIREQALRMLRETMLPEGLEAMNETILTAPSASDVMAAAETLPLMADRRLVLVREPVWLSSKGGDSEGGDALCAFLDRLPDTACIVFYVNGMPDGRKKLAAALKKKATVVNFDRLSDASLSRWIGQRFRALGKAISQEDAAFLSFTAGNELMQLMQEIAKIAAHGGDRADITRSDIEEMATKTLECTVFQMVDALVDGRQAEAFTLLHSMLVHGEARIGILAMLARQYRNLLHLKRLMNEHVPKGEWAKRLGVPPFAVRRLRGQVRALSDAQLRERLDLCVDADYAIKSGKMRDDAALSRTMLRLCGEDIA